MSDGDPAALARQWLLESASGTLCTLSKASGIEGWPFGSIVPFVLDEQGRPIVLIADIAEHTKNAAADPRVSLFVSEKREGDPQAGWRLNLAGHLQRLRLDDDGLDRLRARYIEKVPAAAKYSVQHDFFFWRLDVERVRNIAGFGRIHWIEGKDILRDPAGGGVGDAKAGAIAHMNADHAANMIEMITGLCGFTPQKATMVDLDRTGMMVVASGSGDPSRLLHFSFGKEIEAKDIRHAVVDVLKRARTQPSP
ncbi:MAG: DUF2470 domain-containing protein [Deltaproteobacteria bacterium]|nr:DUF2470 domain-containing protein [Deltaproteobacteria bacterium]